MKLTTALNNNNAGQYPGEYTNKTWVFSQSSKEWREGPELNAHRTRLGCGKMYSAFHDKDMIVAMGGFGIKPNCDPKSDDCFRYGENGTYTGRRIVLDSVEMIDPENLDENQWQQGKSVEERVAEKKSELSLLCYLFLYLPKAIGQLNSFLSVMSTYAKFQDHLYQTLSTE